MTTAAPSATTTSTITSVTSSSRGNKNPPLLQKAKSYDDWVKKLKVWRIVTCLPVKDQGGAILMSLEGAEGEAEDALLEMSVEELTGDNSVDLIVERLDKIYKKNETLEKFEILDNFTTYCRPHHVSINDFIIEFDKRLTKTRKIGTQLSDDLLGYRLVKSANLSEQDEKMVKATCDLTYESVKSKLKGIYGDAGSQTKQQKQTPVVVKSEQEVYETQGSVNSYEQDIYYETLTNTNKNKGNYYNNRGRGRGGYNNRGRGGSNNRGRGGWRGSKSNPKVTNGNKLDREGNVTKCFICKSEFHYADECQHRSDKAGKNVKFDEKSTLHLTDEKEETSLMTEHIQLIAEHIEGNKVEEMDHSKFNDICPLIEELQSLVEQVEFPVCSTISKFDSTTTLHLIDEKDEESTEEHIVLLQSKCEEETKLSELLSETWNAAILDTGATKTVAGKTWVDNYISSLPQFERDQVEFKECSTAYRFGDGKGVSAKESVTLPTTIGDMSLWISTDIIEKDIPLLLSRESMKKGKMKLDLESDKAELFGMDVNLKTTKKGHYILPLTNSLEFFHRFENKKVESFTLSVTDCSNDHEVASKLHKVFAHPSEKKLIDLIDAAGKKWSNNKNLKKEIKLVSKNCQTCEKFRRPSPRPTVGLSMATSFNECVAMDLKFYQGKIIFHLIDHASRLSSGSRVSSKDPVVILKSIFKNWISIYGRPQKFLSDNGGEFMNHQFIDMCEKMSISVKNTAGESPWSNGLVERHNLVISEMMDKVLEESKCDFDLALAWCLNAKNSLKNVNGFTPYQIAMGQNPTLPVAVENDLPGNSLVYPSDIVRKNLNAIHTARKAYIETEFSRKIKKALSGNVREASATKYYTGDRVLYKRDVSNEWKGPGTVIGQDGSKVLIKHGPYTVSVHPCRVVLKSETNKLPVINESIEEVEDSSSCTVNNEVSIPSVDAQIIEDDDSDTDVEIMSNTRVTNSAPSGSIVQEIKKGTHLSVNKTGLSNNWKDVQVTSRAGKATGKAKNCWNVKECDTGEEYYVNLDKVQWTSSDETSDSNTSEDLHESSEGTSEECLVSNDVVEHQKNAVLKAKLDELQSWKNNNVYTEVKDTGQDRLSVRWVMTEKIKEENIVPKARLCARGFEEVQDFRKDSPTCSKETIRFVMAIAASLKWSINAIDIKTAFLQGNKFSREVYVKPPKEAGTKCLWKLNKCVYGLADASRQWYLTLKDEVVQAGGRVSVHEPGLFFTQNECSELTGLMPCHVDDILWCGTNSFKHGMINRLQEVFVVGTSSSVAFKYVGIDIKQEWDTKSIVVSQDSYIDSLQYVNIHAPRLSDKNARLTDEEVHNLRGAVGQLNWLSCVSRPDISFDVSVLSSNIKDATVSDLIQVNKVIKKVKNDKSYITFSTLDLDSLNIVSFADASYNNLKNAGSQGGHVIFLVDKDNNCCPLEWKSNRLKRVVRSALAAETLACADCVEACRHWMKVINEVLRPRQKVKVVHHTDSKSLVDHLDGTKVINDRLLRVDINVIRENIESQQVRVVKVDGDNNVSDILTKHGVKAKQILEIIKRGKI